MYKIITTKKFDKDIKKAKKRNKNLNKLWDIVELIAQNKPLSQHHCHHKLQGFKTDIFECHIEPNWLLIWTVHDGYIKLIRTGTHSDLF